MTDSEIVNRALLRLVAVFGSPWGRDQALARQMAAEWTLALEGLPAATVDGAVTRWLRDETKWPKPAELRRFARSKVEVRVSEVAERDGVHERRLDPTDEMKLFAFRRSMLRLNPTWGRFLDSLHPTHEHCFFAACVMGEYAHELKNCTSFDAEYIREKWGEKLEGLFGRRIVFRNVKVASA